MVRYFNIISPCHYVKIWYCQVVIIKSRVFDTKGIIRVPSNKYSDDDSRFVLISTNTTKPDYSVSFNRGGPYKIN